MAKIPQREMFANVFRGRSPLVLNYNSVFSKLFKAVQIRVLLKSTVSEQELSIVARRRQNPFSVKMFLSASKIPFHLI